MFEVFVYLSLCVYECVCVCALGLEEVGGSVVYVGRFVFICCLNEGFFLTYFGV